MRYERVRWKDVVLLCFLWAFLGGLVYAELGCDSTQAKEVRVVKEVKSVYDTDRLTRYVYRNSYRISKETAREIVTEAMKTKCPLLMLSIMKVESNYNPAAVSRAGARGLGQVMPVKELKKARIVNDYRDLFNVKANVKAMEYVFNRKLKAAHGNYLHAIERYFGAHNSKYLAQVSETYMELMGEVEK